MNAVRASVFCACINLLVLCPAVKSHESSGDDLHALPDSNKQWLEAVNPWNLLEMAISPAFAYASRVSITNEGAFRIIKSNGIPDHLTGKFPNAGNPNTMSEQAYSFRVSLNPSFAQSPSSIRMNLFGVAINGVPFDPAANEFFRGDRFSGWQYEAMYLGPRLGIDENNAHVQPGGAYHYHGLPKGLFERFASILKPVLLGYAADGFPIYGPYGYSKSGDAKSPLQKLKSSYAVRKGFRPGLDSGGPGGVYNGEFVQDYEYLAGTGDLDECNGRFAVTQEYPDGIYHYVLTDSFPYVPRLWRGVPDPSFFKHPPRSPWHNHHPGGRPSP